MTIYRFMQQVDGNLTGRQMRYIDKEMTKYLDVVVLPTVKKTSAASHDSKVTDNDQLNHSAHVHYGQAECEACREMIEDGWE